MYKQSYQESYLTHSSVRDGSCREPTSQRLVTYLLFLFLKNVARHQLYLEFLRSSIVGILEAPERSLEEILWTGFLYLKASQHYPDLFPFCFFKMLVCHCLLKIHWHDFFKLSVSFFQRNINISK